MVEAARAQTAAVRHALLRKEGLHQDRLIGAAEVAIAGEQVKQFAAAERAQREQLRVLEIRDPAAELRQAEADLTALQVRREQARCALDDHVLKAPQAGAVLRVQVSVGEMLDAARAQPALLFCPRGALVVRAELAQELASGVALGAQAFIEDYANARGAWTGRVLRLSNWVTQRRSVWHEPFQVNDVRTLECLIALDQPAQPLRLGQRMKVRLQPHAQSGSAL
jgi:multidrug resistance efflux pump